MRYSSSKMAALALVLTVATLAGPAAGQSNGPGYRGGMPVSSKLSETSETDPWGLTALMIRLGFPQAYFGLWPYEYPYESVAIDPSIDPAVEDPITGTNHAINGSYRVVGNTGVPTAHAQPFANDLALFIIRPNLQLGSGADTHLQTYGDPQNYTWNGQTYDYNTIYNMTDNTYEPFYITELAFCGGNTLLPDGRAFIVGGIIVTPLAPTYTWGAQSVRIFDSEFRNYSQVATMSSLRWYPTVMTFPDGNMLILGGNQAENGNWGADKQPSSSSNTGTFMCSPNSGGGFSDPRTNNPTYQIFYPNNETLSVPLVLTILMESNPVNTYPFAIVMPTGSTLIIAAAQMQALFLNETEAFQDEAIGDLPVLPLTVTYPSYGSAALLPLQGPSYKAEVMIAGGSSEYCANAMSPASAQSISFDASPGADHSLVFEKTNFPRVMPDLTILPDGRLFLCNGAQIGIAGGTGPNYGAADKGSTVAEIYDPTKPLGQRWSIVGDAQIWRMYHSTAFLTKNAEVFISGSETTGEFRAQLYTPDYLMTSKPRPSISGAPASVSYSQKFTFKYTNVTSVDRVVFHRLTGATHGNHMDQRQVVLDCTPGSGTASCQSPPNSSVAPPGIYYLFAAYQGVPSVAEFVSVGMSAAGTAGTPMMTTAG